MKRKIVPIFVIMILIAALIGVFVPASAQNGDLINPRLCICKVADVPFSKVGDTVNYTITITNSGNVALIDVDVVDSLLGALWTDGTMAPGDQQIFNIAYVVQSTDPDPLVNTVTATADTAQVPDAICVQACVSLDLVHPAIDIMKQCCPGSGCVGDTIKYCITITNMGDVDLENVTVSDSLLGDLSGSFVDYLSVGQSESKTFYKAIESSDPNPLINTARVNATVIVLCNPVCDEACCSVTVRVCQGCTPGFWKNNAINWDAVAWIGYDPEDSFEAVFGIDVTLRGNGKTTIDSPTLLQALEANGGGINALARHATAALLNISNPYISYAGGYTAAELIAAVQAAVASGNSAIEALKNMLDYYNNFGCPINQHGSTDLTG